MPVVSKSQFKYAQMVAHSDKASPDKRAWAEEVLRKSGGVDVSALPEHKSPYPSLGRRVRGVKRYRD